MKISKVAKIFVPILNDTNLILNQCWFEFFLYSLILFLKIVMGFLAFQFCVNLSLFLCLDNKRLDEWVSLDRLDLSRLQPPKAEEKRKNPFSSSSAAQSPATPLPKQMSPGKASSPDREPVTSNGGLPKKGAASGRKRKSNVLEEVSNTTWLKAREIMFYFTKLGYSNKSQNLKIILINKSIC